MYNENKTSTNYDMLSDLVNDHQLTPYQVLDIFVYWHGRESITNEFIEHAKEEIDYM